MASDGVRPRRSATETSRTCSCRCAWAAAKQNRNLICDAQDLYSEARCLVDLIGMTTRTQPDEDQQAIGMAVTKAIDAMDMADRLLNEAKSSKTEESK